MIKLYSGEQVKRIDQAAIANGTPGIVLMKRAGRSAFDAIQTRWPRAPLCVLCGAGNNAGDGYVIAALARQAGISVSLYYIKAPSVLTGEALLAANYARQEQVPMQSIDAIYACSEPFSSGQKEAGGGARSAQSSSSGPVIVDALLGTGLQGSLRSEYAMAIQWINAQSKPVFSVDVPSGLCSATGSVKELAVKADVTMSFIGRKQGLYTAQGPEFGGERRFDGLGVEAVGAVSIDVDDVAGIQLGIDSIDTEVRLLAECGLRNRLARAMNSHKGSHGHAAIIGGNTGMAGAVLMSAEACLYAGAGLISVYTRQVNVSSVHTRIPEVMALALEDDGAFKEQLDKTDVICIGPGLGRSDWSHVVLRDALNSDKRKVLDADALNIIASGGVSLTGNQHVLTPHPGEAARLLRCSVADIQNDRFGAIASLHKQYGGVVVLKGCGTLVSDGSTVWVCDYGNPGMAVGGMGDVLAGVIAALLSQGLTLAEAARLGVLVHSLAADVLVKKQGELGLRATELFNQIRSLLNGKTDIPC